MSFLTGLSRSPLLRADWGAVLFSAKTFAAAMLAYYVALQIGLPKPYWSIVTVYVVSQTSAGASLSRGLYRLAGTLVGTVATLAIVPAFAGQPIVGSVVIAGWIGLCLFLSLLDRTPRAYAFVLAGYTASLIGFPGVSEPGAIFGTAAVRLQEIVLGILCAVLIHRYVAPRRMTGQFLAKVSTALADARRLTGDALQGEPGATSRDDRRRLASDLLALQLLATHLPYDPAATPDGEKVMEVHDRLARLLPLSMEIETRIQTLRTGRQQPDALPSLIADVADWITAADSAGPDGKAIELIGRARRVQTTIEATAVTSGDRIAANLCGHLAELIDVLEDCLRTGSDLATATPSMGPTSRHRLAAPRGYVFHRDPWMAARASLGAATGIALGCGLWMWSAWPDGATAVSILGVCCTLFGNVDTPAPNLQKYMVGSVYGVLIALAYSVWILPQVTEFPALVAALAPAFLFAGSLQARPATTYMALGMTLTIPILAGLGAAYSGDVAASLNTAVAVFAALLFGLVSMSLFQTVPVDAAIRRLLDLSRRDVRQRALGGGGDEAHWTSLMVDRTALLFPRLRASRTDWSDILDDTLHHLRIGHVSGRLHKARGWVEDDIGDRVGEILGSVAARFAKGADRNDGSASVLGGRIDALAAVISHTGTTDRPLLLNLLIDLRFALGPIGGTGETNRP